MKEFLLNVKTLISFIEKHTDEKIFKELFWMKFPFSFIPAKEVYSQCLPYIKRRFICYAKENKLENNKDGRTGAATI